MFEPSPYYSCVEFYYNIPTLIVELPQLLTKIEKSLLQVRREVWSNLETIKSSYCFIPVYRGMEENQNFLFIGIIYFIF